MSAAMRSNVPVAAPQSFTITLTADPVTGAITMPIPPAALAAVGILPATEVIVVFDDDTSPDNPTLKIQRDVPAA